MKKTVLSGFILASLLLIAVISGCKKEEATNAPSNVGTATITGKVQTELDLTNTTAENVPTGIKIIAVINSADLITNPIAGVTYENISYETNVGVDGKYTFTNIAAANKNVTVHIYPVDFENNQVQADTTTILRKIFSVVPFTIDVIKGTNKISDIYYTY